MESQLTLIETEGTSWGLDEPTRQTGRLGVAMAREALRRAAPPTARSDPGTSREPAMSEVRDRNAA